MYDAAVDLIGSSCITARRKNIWVLCAFLPSAPTPTPLQPSLKYSQLGSIYGDWRSIAFEAAGLLRAPVRPLPPRPPLQRDGVKGSRVVLDPSGSQGRAQAKSLNYTSQTQRGCTDFRPIFISQETNKDRKKMYSNKDWK